MRYVIRRISPLSALIYGLLLGLFGWLVPGILLGWITRSIVLSLFNWLDGLQLTIPLPLGEEIALDLAAILSLSGVQTRLAALAAQDSTLMIAVLLGTIAAGMLLTGLSALLGALVYNLIAGIFGGAEITLDALDGPARPVTALPAAAIAAQPRTTTPAVKIPTASTSPPRPAASAPLATPRPRSALEKAGQPAPAAWLVAGDERRALRDGVTRIGSAPDNDIVLAGLAPQHAEIRRESGRYLIYDLGSRRTWVNDTQVAAVHMLKDGFRLQLGQAEFVMSIAATSPAPVEGT
jgi:hypothetical protein